MSREDGVLVCRMKPNESKKWNLQELIDHGWAEIAVDTKLQTKNTCCVSDRILEALLAAYDVFREEQRENEERYDQFLKENPIQESK